MLKVGGRKYNLTDSKDREELHNKVDSWVEDNRLDLLMSGELSEELSNVHELISDENSEGLSGTWFEKGLTMEHWYEPVTDLLEEMDIEYKVFPNGDVKMFYFGRDVVFTRYSKVSPKEDSSYEVCLDGIIRRDVLEKYGIYYVKEYYLPKQESVKSEFLEVSSL